MYPVLSEMCIYVKEDLTRGHNIAIAFGGGIYC